MAKDLPNIKNDIFADESPGGLSADSLKDFLRTNLIFAISGFLGLVFLAAGMISLLSGSPAKSSEVVFEEGSGGGEEDTWVDVSGAVVRPGVYKLKSTDRVKEALISAGGLSSSADRDWVAKNLNLAEKVTDGAKIYIPKVGQAEIVSQQSGTEGGKVSINAASSADLDKLPGIGPVTAQKIIDGRPYQSLDDLASKKVIGPSTLEKIKDQLTVW